MMKKIVDSPLLPFFALAFVYFILHLILPSVADDTWAIYNPQINIFEYVLNANAQGDIQRLLSALFSMFMLKHKFLFIILNPLIIALSAYMLNRLLGDVKNRQYAVLSCFIIAMFPFWDFATAGYIMTTTVYLWIVCSMSFTFLILKKTADNEPFKRYQYPLYIAACIYASNSELGSLIILIAFCAFFFATKLKKINVLIVIAFFISLAALIYLTNRQGIAIRFGLDVQTWFPDFMQMSILGRAEMAISSTLYHFFFKPNAPFLIFYVLLIMSVWQRFQDKHLRLLTLFPGFIVLIFGYFLPFARDNMTLYGYISPYSASITQYLLLGLLILLTIMIVAFVVLAFPSRFKQTPAADGGTPFGKGAVQSLNNKSILCLLILSIGFISRMPMMFAPSIWGSQTRTFTFANFAFLAAAFMLYGELKNTKFDSWKWLNTFIYILAALNLIFIFLYALYQGGHLPQGLSEMIGSTIKYYDLLGWEMAVLSIGR
jgi:hypothetical protein